MMEAGTIMVGYQPLDDTPNFFRNIISNAAVQQKDVPAATGRQVTLVSPSAPPLMIDMFDLALRNESRLELIVHGKKDGRMRHWLLNPETQAFQSDRHGEIAPTLADAIAPAALGNEFTATLVPRGSGFRLALDRDGDGYFDTSEIERGYDPADPTSHPGQIVSISKLGNTVMVSWESVAGFKYAVEGSFNFQANGSNMMWNMLGPPFTAIQPITTYTDSPPANVFFRFYRVRKEP